MFHFLGFIFIIIIAVLFIGLALIGSFLRGIFGAGNRRTGQKGYHSKDEGEYVDFEEVKDE